MTIKPGLKFQVKNPYSVDKPNSRYEVIRVQGNVCVCTDLDSRFTIAMPVAFVKSKLGNINKKEKL